MDRLKRIKCFFLDMDGTFYLGNRILPGSLDFITEIQRRGIDYLFLTNNSSKDSVLYRQKLLAMGLDTDKILTSGQAAAMYLSQNMPGKRVFVLGTEALKDEMARMGVSIAEDSADVALLAYDTELTYSKLCKFCEIIRGGAEYIATHPDINCPSESIPLPDAGAFADMIAASTGKRPGVVIGKPNEYIIKAALERTGRRRSEVCMVGDRLMTDIASGTNNGVLSVLVLTGEAVRQDIPQSPHKPDLVFERLYDIVDYI